MNAQTPGRLRQLVVKINERRYVAEGHAMLAHEGENLPPQDMAVMFASASVDADARLGLEELYLAKKAVMEDPLARHAYLTEAIKMMAEVGSPSPEDFFTRMMDALTTYADRRLIPLFRALTWNDPAINSHPTRMVIPIRRVSIDNDENLLTYGPMVLIPNHPASDGATLNALKVARVAGARKLVNDLEKEFVANIRYYVKYALYLFEETSVVSHSDMSRFETVEGHDRPVMKNPRIKNKSRRFLCFDLSPQEFFMIRCDGEHKAQAERLYDGLNRLRHNNARFLSGELVVNRTMVLEHLKKFDDIITPTEFLEGQSGMCAVVHSNWIVNKSTDATAEVIVVLRREGDFWWWCICNSEAALALFNGGNFRYHKRAPYVLPTHLVALLKGGKQLVDTTNL